MMAGSIVRERYALNLNKEDNMKKYGIYVACDDIKSCAWLAREYSVLRDAVTEAFRLSRCRRNQPDSRFADIFIVGDNTGIVLDTNAGRTYITYYVDHFIVFDVVIGQIVASIENDGQCNMWIVKEGVI